MEPRADVLASGALARPDRDTASTRRRVQAWVVGALLALTGLAWAESVRRMAGMASGPGAYDRAFGPFLSNWAVMMTAMMLPAIALAVAVTAASRPVAGPATRPPVARLAGVCVLLVAEYLAVWTVAGAVGYAVLRSASAVAGGLFEWDRAGRGVAVAVLIIAAGYQFTAAKRDSLSHCSRLARPGAGSPHRAGAVLREGVRLGAWCVACSWALMAALFALGAMSLQWMVLIAVLVTAERIVPRPAAMRVAVAVVVAALAVGIALAPTHVPGLTIPGDAPAMPTMQGAGGQLDTVPAWTQR